ncbi:MAG: DedA family protein [Bacilli bacterium]
MENWITNFMEAYGYVGVFLLIMLENIFPPIPSEVILTFGGFMTTTTSLSIYGVIVASTAGSVVGAVILYQIGRYMNRNRMTKFIARWGHILRLKVDDVEKAERWFERYGVWTVFFCRFIPLIRSLISIPAGMAQMSFWLFFFFTTLGTVIWNTVLIVIGAKVGSSWEQIVMYMDIYANFVYVILGVAVVVGCVYFFSREKIKN